MIVPHATKLTWLRVFYLTTERLYPANLGLSLEEAKLVCLRVLFTDEASMFLNDDQKSCHF